MSSQSYHNELLRIIKQMILDLLREWRQPLDRTTGSIPSNQIPPAGTGSSVGGVTFNTGTPQSVSTSGSAGGSATVNYADHVHAHGLLALNTGTDLYHATATTGTAGFFGTADKAKLGTVVASVVHNTVFAGPAAVLDPDAPATFRSLVAKDLPVTVARTDADSLFTAAQTITVTDAGTITNTDILVLSHDSSGTPGAAFGAGLLFEGEDSTTADQSMARLEALWTTATHASRTAALAFLTVNNAGALTEHVRFTGPGAVWIGKTSGGLTGTADLDVAGTVNIDGAIILPAQVANRIYGGPSSGGNAAPTFRALVAADIPSLDAAKITTGVLADAQHTTDGTWTPTYDGVTPGATTYTTQSGTYTKIGRVVFAAFSLVWTAASGTGAIRIGGLPFTSLTGVIVAFAIQSTNVTFANGSIQGFLQGNQVVAQLISPATNAAGTELTVEAAGTLRGMLVYLT